MERPKSLNARFIIDGFMRELAQQEGYTAWGLYDKPEPLKP